MSALTTYRTLARLPENREALDELGAQLTSAAPLIALYRQATPDQVERGRRWYPATLRRCRRIARETGTPLRRVVATMAITSPDAQLRTNVAWTETACASHGTARVGRYPNTAHKRYGPVLTGDVTPSAACSGDKVKNFYAAILGNVDAVVLDRWALRNAGHHRDNATPLQYARIANLYRDAASLVDEEPRAFQAILWIVARERHSRNGYPVRLADIDEL